MGSWKTLFFGVNETSGDIIEIRLNAMRHHWLGIENLRDEQECENLRGFIMSEIQLSFWLERMFGMLLGVGIWLDLKSALSVYAKQNYMLTMMTIPNHSMCVGCV